MKKEEEDERDEAMAEVMDPMFLMGRADADAEGEVDDGALINGHGHSVMMPDSTATGSTLDIMSA